MSAARIQPQGRVRINNSHPLARGLTAAFAFNGTFAAATPSGRTGKAIITSGPTFKAGPNGLYALGNGSGKVVTDLLPSDLGMSGSSPRTIIVEFDQYDTNVGKCVYSFGDSSGATRSQFTLQMATSYKSVNLGTYANDIGYQFATLTGTAGASFRVFLAITYDGATGITFRSYAKLISTTIDGTVGQVYFGTQNSTLAAPLVTGNTVPLNLMGGGTYSFPAMDRELYFASFHNRVLTPAEIDAIYANKWQLFDSQAPMLSATTAAPPADTLGGSSTQSNDSTDSNLNQAHNLVVSSGGVFDSDGTFDSQITNQAIQTSTTSSESISLSSGLIGDAVNQSNLTGVAGLAQIHDLTGTITLAGASSQTVAVDVARTLSGASTTQPSNTPAPSITKAVATAGAITEQASVASVGVIGVVRVMAGTTSTQGATSGVGAVGGSGTLTAANDDQYNSVLSTGISVTKTLSGGDTGQQTTSSQQPVQVAHSTTGTDSSQGNSSPVVAISSATIHNLSGEVTVSSTSTYGASSSQMQVLSGQPSVGSNSSSGAAISSVQVLGANEDVVQNTTSVGLLNSLVSLVAAINTQANSTPISAIAQIQNLVAAATNDSKVAGAGAVGQIRLLFGTPRTQVGASGTGSIVIGALITIGEVSVAVECNPYDVQVHTDKYLVAVSNEPFDITVTSRRA